MLSTNPIGSVGGVLERGRPNVSCGSDSDFDVSKREVRFAPMNGRHQRGAARPASVNRAGVRVQTLSKSH